MLRKIMIALVAAGTLSGSLLATGTQAEAHCWDCGGAAAAGIVGGLVLGGVIAAAASHPTYVDERDCYRQRVRVYDGRGRFHVERRLVCR